MSTTQAYNQRSVLPDNFAFEPTPSASINNTPSSLRSGTAEFSSAPSSSHHSQQRLARPVSEILRPGSVISPETEALDKWFEDLQEYERNLESMASANIDPKYKEEIQHVEQWFRYLSEAERTAAVYSLLKYSSQVQIRFFITVLQQMDKKNPLGALLTPVQPEKTDMHSQLSSAMAKAEWEASQKLLSVLPYQTGQVMARPPNPNASRRNIDRHSFALGDTQEYNRLFNGGGAGGSIVSGSDFLTPHTGYNNASSLMDDSAFSRLKSQNRNSIFAGASTGVRPKSVIESDLSSIFNSDWTFGAAGGGMMSDRGGRPKSADVSNWSFATVSSDANAKAKDAAAAAWGVTPGVNSFSEHGKAIERPSSASDVDHLTMLTANWHLPSQQRAYETDDSKNFRRRPKNRTSIPGTVPETDENNTNIVLSLHDEHHQPYGIFGQTSLSQPYPTSSSRPSSRATSPIPSASNSSSLYPTSSAYTPMPRSPKPNHHLVPPSSGAHFGQFLNPSDRLDADLDYLSDHSDASAFSHSNRYRKFGQRPVKEKKHVDVVDMQLLQDIPAWLRSLRLHKYNPIFENIKWQEMVKLSDDELLARGVSALGARRKMLKVFEQVKAHCEANNIPI
ncbi:uncharacterized protein BYT42DRAFT_587788 [Radiomyces spectabilis]|uniref:uncharacterized protein n=1 Tax=Radiomyces spectabilis TaxID=64574 RepID=UPI002220C96B|nr:uncharacterized protein BYT42DRAFT_587788 [Radiomyces spectabilis]KAI8366758.1 hypothetical protein BYT42DRAFT_587788 [Radiomyces spectabilis]